MARRIQYVHDAWKGKINVVSLKSCENPRNKFTSEELSIIDEQVVAIIPTLEKEISEVDFGKLVFKKSWKNMVMKTPKIRDLPHQKLVDVHQYFILKLIEDGGFVNKKVLYTEFVVNYKKYFDMFIFSLS